MYLIKFEVTIAHSCAIHFKDQLYLRVKLLGKGLRLVLYLQYTYIQTSIFIFCYNEALQWTFFEEAANC